MKARTKLLAFAVAVVVATFIADATGLLTFEQMFGGLVALGGMALIAYKNRDAKKAPAKDITPAEKAEAAKVNQDAQDKSSTAIELQMPADVVAADDADGHLSAKRDSDVDAVTTGYIEGVLDRSGAEVSGVFSGAGDREDPPVGRGRG